MTKNNLAEQMEQSLPKDRWDLLQLVREEATQAGLPLYIVGGSVRDLVLGRRLNDFDLTVEGEAIKLARLLASKHGGRVTAHSKFGTAKWFLPKHLTPETLTPFDAAQGRPDTSTPDALDLISARSETYKHPAALPTVKPGSISDDLRRRDFTINALALRLDGPHFGELRDDLDGLEDLQKGIVRVLHPGSFIDDPTRLYRAVRYAGRYGFKIAEDTLALIPAARPFVAKLSAQRIRHELDLILDEPNAVSMLRRLDELGLLAPIHPALADFDRSNLATLKSGDASLQNRNSRWVLWLMHLTDQEIESLHERLHFTTSLLKILRSASLLNANLNAVVGLKPSQVVALLEGYSIKALEVVSCAVQDEQIKKILTKYLSEWWHVQPKATGHDLKKRGIPPGPKYAEILRRLRAAWLDGEVKTEEEEKALLDHLQK
ncbi:MAG TPA: CCA tRNA nucleotidyltransferase [Anaerolineales bacterium]|nr:CCA tRNA nucleotidyltransferase [Anaerolineales bacterium]